MERVADLDENGGHRDRALAVRRKALEIAQEVMNEADATEAKESEAQKARRDAAVLAIVRLRVRTGDLERAIALVKEGGEPRDTRTKALIGALGRSGDVASALSQVDALPTPQGKVRALGVLFGGLLAREKGQHP